MKEDLYDAVVAIPTAQDQVRFFLALRPDAALHNVPGSHRRPLTVAE